MSVAPSEVRLETTIAPPVSRPRPLPPAAMAYLVIVAVAATAFAAPFLIRLQTDHHDWATFAVLSVGAAFAQLFKVRGVRNLNHHITPVFLIPAVLLLPPQYVALLAVIQHVPEWLKVRYPWYIGGFNLCNFTLTNLCMWAAAHGIMSLHGVLPSEKLRFALAALVASCLFVLVHHGLLAPMLRLARGHRFRDTGLFSYQGMSAEFVLATLGVAFATFWKLDPWLLPFAGAPLLMIKRSLEVPQLQAEARIDPKTGLFNTRHFATMFEEELSRAKRFDRPMSLIMADLDLLRDINNTHGHLAGDAVLVGIADTFREELRGYDIPARFGGEEFSILLPETEPAEALEIAERIRKAVAAKLFEVETAENAIRATISMGIAAYPRDGQDMTELVHQADVAVYRAKLQGRNRVLDAASDESLLASPAQRAPKLAKIPTHEHAAAPVPPKPEAREEFAGGGVRADALTNAPTATVVQLPPAEPVESSTRPHHPSRPHFFSIPRRLALVVGFVGVAGTAAGLAGAVFGHSTDMLGLIVIIALVGVGQALSLEVERVGTISLSAVGALSAAAIIGPRAALALAVTMAAVEWSARRSFVHETLFNIGLLSLACLAASAAFTIHPHGPVGTGIYLVASLVAGLVYFVVDTGLLTLAVAVADRESPFAIWKERFRWLTLHYVVYGFIAGVIAEAYKPIGVWAIVVFSLPLFLIRTTQEAYLKHTQRSAQKLREAAETIQIQNVSLEEANRLLRERSTAAMESLSATVDARDAYTAGHSRRVQQLALAIGRQLGLSQPELELLGHAALFHDIGKLAVPDAILLKPASLTDEEWALMCTHAEEGASIINRLGFLSDAVPAIRHHHERYDGRGYPDGLKGEEIPLGARIIHVADAFDSMMTTRVYRRARPVSAALEELRNLAGEQFCPRCVAALDALVADESQLAFAQ
jgi:diguanylate cyclase (GGDEF)-like protein/putative nucleotidyltransferase with HDIG domain